MLKRGQIIRLVNDYIGVLDGYLGDFSYNSHAEFYPCYCDLEINPFDYQGTTREKFIAILSSASPHDQAKIIRGVFKKYPVESFSEEVRLRKQAFQTEYLAIAERLASSGISTNPLDFSKSSIVFEVLQDAETLLLQRGAKSALDRVHTALHGYLVSCCERAGLVYQKDINLLEVFKLIRDKHPAFQDLGEHNDEIIKVLRSLSALMDALNNIRNRGSLAHPNECVLDDAESHLMINTAKTLLHYLADKLEAKAKAVPKNEEVLIDDDIPF